MPGKEKGGKIYLKEKLRDTLQEMLVTLFSTQALLLGRFHVNPTK